MAKTKEEALRAALIREAQRMNIKPIIGYVVKHKNDTLWVPLDKNCLMAKMYELEIK